MIKVKSMDYEKDIDQQTTRQQQEMERDRKIAETFEKIRHKIVVMSGKGGVGKSTVATIEEVN